MEEYDIHPDFLKYRNDAPPLNPVVLPIINFFMSRALNTMALPEGLTETRHKIKGYRSEEINLSILSPAGTGSLSPALVYFHGGAFAMQAAAYHKRLAMKYALQTPCTVICVDYHLLPKATYPVGLEDCFSAYSWVCRKAEELGIDKNRIAVGGDSAGGALTAGVCLLARDRKEAMPLFEMLIYPVIDKRQNTPSMKAFDDTPLWNSKLNAKMWRMYLNSDSPEKEYASPAESTSLKDMPPTYLEVSEYDCLRDEGIAFAESLQESGVPTELVKTKRTVHGYEIAEQNEIVIESVAKRIEKLRQVFDLINS